MDDTRSFRVSLIHSLAVIGPPSLTVVKNPPSSEGLKPRSCSPSSFSSGFVDLQLSNRRPPNHCSQLPDPLFSTLKLTHPRSENCSDSIWKIFTSGSEVLCACYILFIWVWSRSG